MGFENLGGQDYLGDDSYDSDEYSSSEDEEDEDEPENAKKAARHYRYQVFLGSLNLWPALKLIRRTILILIHSSDSYYDYDNSSLCSMDDVK
jgi:hypothetical protein